jgi:hypothetical protein
VVSGRTLVFTGLAVGAGIGLAMAARRRSERADRHDEHTLADRTRERERAIPRADELMLERSSELSALDGGYDLTATAAPSTIDLR